MRYFRSFSIYAFTLFLNAALSFAGFSMLTHYLSEVDYGIINLYNSFTIFLMPFVSIGIPFVLGVDYFKMESDAYRKHFSNALVIPVLSCLFFLLVILLVFPLIQRLLKINEFFALTIPFGCLMVVLNEVFLYLFRNQGKRFLFAGYSIGKTVLELGITLMLVIGAGCNWQGRIGGNLIALVGCSLIIFYLIFRWKLFTTQIDKKEIQAVLFAGLPFIPERLAIFVLAYSDRFYIDHFIGTAAVGYYGAGAQVAIIVNLAILSLNNTFYPGLFQNLSQVPVSYRTIRKITLVFIGISLLITLFVLAITPILFKYFIGPDFQPGQKFALLLTVGSFFWAIYNVFIAFLLNLKKNKAIMLISLFGMTLSLLGNFFSIRYFGAIGAAYTNMTVYFFMALVTIFTVHKFYDLKKLFSRPEPVTLPAEEMVV